MRVALCIGCNAHDHLNGLISAETDATNMFNVLTSREHGDYNISKSMLLLSPSVGEIRTAFEELLYSDVAISDFIFFFAGHAGVERQTLYLAAKNTDPRKLAISGFNFSDIARIVASANVAQANFVIDACQSGGVAHDIPTILKDELFGTANSIGLTFLVAAAANQTAAETSEGGAFTTALIPLLRGDIVIQRRKPFLDAFEIGAVIQPRGTVSGEQTVSTWALNLQGPNRFSRNPHFDASAAITDEISASLNNRRLPTLSLKDLGTLKQLAVHCDAELDDQELERLLKRIIESMPSDDALALISGLAEGMVEQAALASDPFLASRVIAIFVGQLMPKRDDAHVGAQIQSFLEKALAHDWSAIISLESAFEQDKYILLGAYGGVGEFYLLPARIADVLGRIGLQIIGGDLTDAQIKRLEVIAAQLTEFYGNSILAMCEEQSASIFVFLVACCKCGWYELKEEIAGRLYNDIIMTRGRVAAYNLDGERCLQVVLNRYEVFDHHIDRNLYSCPSDLVAVILFFVAASHLDEAVDNSFILLDHTPINFFVPTEIGQCGMSGPMSGANMSYAIGHGIWNCADLRRVWLHDVAPALRSGIAPPDRFELFAIALGSLLQRDRVPWQIAAYENHVISIVPECKVTIT